MSSIFSTKSNVTGPLLFATILGLMLLIMPIGLALAEPGDGATA